MGTNELGESTLRWPPFECHIVLLSRDVHVWMYPTSNFQKTIHNISAYYVKI
jgi:hypothetical protein